MTTTGQDPVAMRNMQALKKKSFEVNFELDGTPYIPIENIGIGAYGVVCSATHSTSGEKVAIKKIPGIFGHPTIAKRTYREIRILKHFKHDNIIGIREILKPTGPMEKLRDVYIVFDLMESDLHRIIHSKQDLTDEHIRYFLYQLLRGLKYIHSGNVIHRDLKPGNLLVNENCDLKIGDFGMARGLASAGSQPSQNEMLMTQYVATRWYRAPELIVPTVDDYTGAVDMWSVGCIFAEMLGRRHIFPGRHQKEQLTLIVGILGNPDTKFLKKITSEQIRKYFTALGAKQPVPMNRLYPKASSKAINLLRKMLVIDPAERLTVEGALRDLYLSKYHDPDDEPICIPAFDFSFEKQSLDNNQLKDAIIKEIMDFHRKPPSKLVFDFRPVPKEELLQTVKSPGGTTHDLVGASGLQAFLQQADQIKEESQMKSRAAPPAASTPFQGLGTFSPARKEFKSPLAVKTENLQPDKGGVMSGNDIEMLSAKSATDSRGGSVDLSVKTETKKSGGLIDVEMLSAKAREEGSVENEAPARTEDGGALQGAPEVEARPMDAKERLKAALLNQGLRRQMQAKEGDKKRPVTAAQRQREREEARKKKKESARQRAKKKKNSPKVTILTEEDRGLLQRWQGMMGRNPSRTETPGLTPDQQPSSILIATPQTVPHQATLVRNVTPPGGLLQPSTTIIGNITPALGESLPLAGVIQDTTHSQASDSMPGSTMHSNMAYTTVSSNVITSSQGSALGPMATLAGPMPGQTMTVTGSLPGQPPTSSYQQGAPLLGQGLLPQVVSVPAAVNTVSNPPQSTLAGAPYTMAPSNTDFTRNQLIFGVSVPRNNRTISLDDESSNDSVLNPRIGDSSPDFVDKLLAGTGGPLNVKLPGSVGALKPLNLPDSTPWTEDSGQNRLPSYTEAVQTRHGEFRVSPPGGDSLIGGAQGQASTLSNIEMVNPMVAVSTMGSSLPSTSFPQFTGQSQMSVVTEYSEPQLQPFQSYQGNPLGGEGQTTAGPADISTRLRQWHMDDLTLAQTPKGTGHGYGLGGEEGSMEDITALLGDNEDKLDSAPPSASLIADWLEITKNINWGEDAFISSLSQELGNLPSPLCD